MNFIKRILILSICLGVSTIVLSGCAKLGFKSSAHASLPGPHEDTKGENGFPVVRPALGRRVFVFDPKLGAWAVYNEQGDRVETGRASGGADYCPDIKRPCRTIVGQFTVYHKRGENCKSSKYPVKTNGGGPMPYCMFFHNGYAIHASNMVPDYNASHGCIRVTPKSAKWLDEHFIKNGTIVIVKPY